MAYSPKGREVPEEVRQPHLPISYFLEGAGSTRKQFFWDHPNLKWSQARMRHDASHVRTDIGVFDVTRFRAKFNLQKMSILEINYTDDVCLMSDSMANLQSYVEMNECRKLDTFHLRCLRSILSIK